MSLRLRLTAAYIGLLVPAIVAFSVVIYLIASARLYGSLDDALIARIDSIKAQLPPDRPLSDPLLTERLTSLDVSSSVNFDFKLVSADDQLIYASSRPVALALPDPLIFAERHRRSMDWKQRGQANRAAYERVTDASGNSVGYLVGAVSLAETDDALEQLRGAFALGGALIIVLTGLPAYLLAGRALRPVREVSTHAAQIERLSNFDVSLPRPKSGGEISELVETLNAMISRVRRVLISQRDFLAISSHELRRPLTVLRTYIDVLDDPLLPEYVRKTSLNEMKSEANSMGRLISDLLFLAREGEETNYRAEVDVQAICQRLYSSIMARDKNHHYRFVHDVTNHVLGDSEHIQQMISNLLDNAAQHTPANGTINLDVAQANSIVRISVSDTGNGIPEEEQPHIFERFFRGRDATSSKVEGYGLGLVIVKHVAETHRGKVSFTSRRGAGSCFTVELPALFDD